MTSIIFWVLKAAPILVFLFLVGLPIYLVFRLKIKLLATGLAFLTLGLFATLALGFGSHITWNCRTSVDLWPLKCFEAAIETDDTYTMIDCGLYPRTSDATSMRADVYDASMAPLPFKHMGFTMIGSVAFIATVPNSLLATLGDVLGLGTLALVLWRKLRRKPKIGCCKKCGYDMRATSERCPECGTVASA